MPISQMKKGGPGKFRDMPKASQPVAKLGLRLRFLSGRSYALPTACPPPTISVTLVTLEPPQRGVSTPSWEAFKQLLEQQMLARHPGSLPRCEVGRWVGSF